MMGACTLPALIGLRRWFNDNFGDLCKSHDDLYDVGFDRKKADRILAIGIISRGYFWLGVFAYIAVRLFGWLHYKPKKEKRDV